MELIDEGVRAMMRWVQSRAPACLPDEWSTQDSPRTQTLALFPHNGEAEDGRALTDNELLVELAGRKCYNSFGAKAGRKSNAEYIAHMQSGDVPHASVLYHAKLSFFIAGVSRRVSHELIRNYVGADRDEEGSPSQESTRFVEHAGFYIIPPKYLDASADREQFQNNCHYNYACYRAMVDRQIADYTALYGARPKGMDYKRILEAASALLMHTVETSWIWTTNPMAIAKMARERDHDGADAEFRRFMRVWKAVAVGHARNLFPQPWMQLF